MINYPYVGQAVVVSGYGLGYVKKITRGRTPYHVRMLDDSRTLTCSNRHLEEATGDDERRARSAYSADLLDDSYAFSELTLGSVVKFNSERHNPSGALFVVISGVKDGRVKIAKLGGDGNRYIRTSTDLVELVEDMEVDAR